MEVSSIALSQDRVSGLAFAAAGFTNLTRDHLDFHGNLEAYYLAKRKLFFELLRPDALAVVNADDELGARLARELAAGHRPLRRFGRSPGAELRIADERLSLDGSAFTLELATGSLPIRSPLIGSHNVENIALAVGLGLGVGFRPEVVTRGVAALSVVPGRLERVEPKIDRAHISPLGFVDYAHTDDALTRVLAALRAVGAIGPRRLVLVFGCGGERDPGKRPLMGKAAALGADLVVTTSDNPRGEDPNEILRQIVPGLVAGGKSELTVGAARAGAVGYLVEPDRRAAISLAASLARPEDVLLVAGKGHEVTQTLGSHKLPFDDRVELRAALARRAA
jgi:UDP-N-acetylmuramoyl-L-alanyl-D-glutamate--2,6-diaminopimelate ligase